MPSPVGHLLGGAAVYAGGTSHDTRSTALLAIALIGSMVPDLDFVPGILIGNMRAFHHGISHSFAFALLFGAVVFLLAYAMDKALASRAAVFALLAYSSHVILDFASVNTGTRGVPLLWPLAEQQFGINLRLFGYFQYDPSDMPGVFHWRNLSPFFRELLILGFVVVLLFRKGRIGRALRARWSRGIDRQEYADRPAHDASRGLES